MTDHLSRRDLFRRMLGRPAEASAVPQVEVAKPEVASSFAKATAENSLALILDRFCLAWQGSFCSVCAERCPVEGAIMLEQGKPRVNPDLCTGCRICHDVCPAPKKAVFLVARKPTQGMVMSSNESTAP